MRLNDLLQGIVAQYGPSVVRGALREFMTGLKFTDAVEWVSEDRSLWGQMPEKYREVFKEYAPKLGPLEWFTVDWAIENAREANPGVASLFLGWPEGREWLGRQIEEIKGASQ